MTNTVLTRILMTRIQIQSSNGNARIHTANIVLTHWPLSNMGIWANLIQDGRAMTNMGGGGPPGVGAITE